MLRMKFIIGMMIAGLLYGPFFVTAQAPTWTLNPFGKEKKPAKYEEKLLASEKTGDKSFGAVRRTLQNATSHYNFYFNANNRINMVIERARIANKDDYSTLLNFYPYSLDNTASQKTDLDSVIYKATAGILLHDLRTEWVDNFYLLIGKAYYLKKDFDSAALTFQFINYNLYPRKKHDDDYNKVVGTNDAGSGKPTGTVSIADKESRNFLQKAFTLPPSRNDALIWQIRTFIRQNEFGDAAGLISILQNDPNLPSRLKNDLDEVTSYWFYAQNNYDSSATHLARALSNADTKEDKSRWEYLLAQMYEMTGKFDLASQYYMKAAHHTDDPVMDIYARLSDAKMLRNAGNTKELSNSIANLLRMAHRDRYESFRDIIYYSAAQLSIQQPDTSNGVNYYAKSIVYTNPASGYRNKSYLQLADIAYSQKHYKDARSFYDSLTLTGKETDIDAKQIDERKEILGRLIPDILGIEREDSLQRLAAMTPAERDAIIKKIIRKYQKENGLKVDDDFTGNSTITFMNNNNRPADLFPDKGGNNGEWYFYNASAKARGFSEFRSKWGKRENIDNWRRKSAATETVIGKDLTANMDPDASPISPDGKGLTTTLGGKTVTTPDTKVKEYTYDALMADIPMNKELMDSSNKLIADYLFDAALIFQNELEDHHEAIAHWQDFMTRFPKDERLADVYFNLSYCYTKVGDPVKAEYYRNLLKTNFASSNAAKLMANPNALKTNQQNPEITAKYQDIYNMFIEGNFDRAIAAKKKADSSYGKNYWSPQLLYIEAMYDIKQRDDSNAITVLKNLQTLYPKSPLKEKATRLIEVLGRRAEIEKYLTDLQITREEEQQVIVADDVPSTNVNRTVTNAPAKTITPVVTKKAMPDSVTTPAAFINKSFTLHPEQPHYVAMILDKVDGVYVNEAKNAFGRFNKESMATVNVTISRDTLDATRTLLLFSPFDNAAAALKYFDMVKKAAPVEVSWLQPAKYSFIIISDTNLQLLKTNKDLSSYRQLITTNFGNRF